MIANQVRQHYEEAAEYDDEAEGEAQAVDDLVTHGVLPPVEKSPA